MTRLLTEVCRPDACTGSREVDALTRGLGPLFRRSRGGVIGGMLQAIAEWKTCLVRALCREFAEGDPCTATRLLPVYANLYAFPSCVALTGDAMCRWIALVGDRTCPPGSPGFLKKAIAFAAPGKDIALTRRPLDGPPLADNEQCPEENAFLFTAPAECFAFWTVARDYPFDPLDGVNPCRRYVIPEIECLRTTIFPHGASVGYRTDPPGPQGEAIWGVPDAAQIDCPAASRPSCDC